MMKKKLLAGFVILLLVFCTIFGYLKFQDIKRYAISSPMMDFEYKKAIVQTSGDKTFTLENLRPIVGQEELKEVIIKNDDNPVIYTPSEKNIESGEFSMNLHMHTMYSDGTMSVKRLLDKAQDYAKNFPEGKYMYVAITDHNTVLGIQNLIYVLQKNPGKYTKIKVVPGIEVFTKYNDSKYSDNPIDIHVLTWCINPYDKFLNEEFYKEDLRDRYNYKLRDFDDVIEMMSDYGIVGVAHPARYITHLNENKYPYIREMLSRLKNISHNDVVFTEGYYQTYPLLPEKDELGDEYQPFLDYINAAAKELGIIRTGSTDTHGESLFRK